MCRAAMPPYDIFRSPLYHPNETSHPEEDYDSNRYAFYTVNEPITRETNTPRRTSRPNNLRLQAFSLIAS
jgi:hypothetical protein